MADDTNVVSLLRVPQFSRIPSNDRRDEVAEETGEYRWADYHFDPSLVHLDSETGRLLTEVGVGAWNAGAEKFALMNGGRRARVIVGPRDQPFDRRWQADKEFRSAVRNTPNLDWLIIIPPGMVGLESVPCQGDEFENVCFGIELQNLRSAADLSLLKHVPCRRRFAVARGILTEPLHAFEDVEDFDFGHIDWLVLDESVPAVDGDTLWYLRELAMSFEIPIWKFSNNASAPVHYGGGQGKQGAITPDAAQRRHGLKR